MLGGGNFIVLGFGKDPQFPEFDIQFLHKRCLTFPYAAEIVVIQFLALGRHGTEQGASGEDQVITAQILVAVDQKVFLFCPHRTSDIAHFFITKQSQDADSLFADRFHGAEKRGFLIQSFARIGAKRGGDAQYCSNGVLPQECR